MLNHVFVEKVKKNMIKINKTKKTNLINKYNKASATAVISVLRVTCKRIWVQNTSKKRIYM